MSAPTENSAALYLARTEELLAAPKPRPSDWVPKVASVFAQLMDRSLLLLDSAELRAAISRLVDVAYADCTFAHTSLSLAEEMRWTLRLLNAPPEIMPAVGAAAAPSAPGAGGAAPITQPLEEKLAADLAAVATLPEDAQAERLAELIEGLLEVDAAQLATNPALFAVANTALETAFGDCNFTHCYLSLAYELEDLLATARTRKDFVKA